MRFILSSSIRLFIFYLLSLHSSQSAEISTQKTGGGDEYYSPKHKRTFHRCMLSDGSIEDSQSQNYLNLHVLVTSINWYVSTAWALELKSKIVCLDIIQLQHKLCARAQWSAFINKLADKPCPPSNE